MNSKKLDRPRVKLEEFAGAVYETIFDEKPKHIDEDTANTLRAVTIAHLQRGKAAVIQAAELSNEIDRLKQEYEALRSAEREALEKSADHWAYMAIRYRVLLDAVETRLRENSLSLSEVESLTNFIRTEKNR